MLQVGEDRFAESVDECFESGGADEVLGEYTADPSALSPDEATRTLRIAETLCSVVVDLVVPSSRDGPRLDHILQAQVAQYLLERQLWQIVHLRSLADRFSL